MSIARHTAYNLAGALLPLAISLVTVPLYLKVIGFERYGVLNLCWLLVGYFGFFDLGIGRATAQRIASLHDADEQQRSQLFWTSAALSAGLAAIATVVFLPLSKFALGVINVEDPATRIELLRALPLLVAAVPIGIVNSVLTGSLEGRRAFFEVNAIASAGSAATAILPLLAAIVLGPELRVLITATLLTRLLVLLCLLQACRVRIPVHRPRFTSGEELRRLVHFGGWTTVSNIVGPLLHLVDRFFIAALRNAAAVALYVVPMNLLMQAAVVPQALARALFPRLASVADEEASQIARQATSAVLFVVTPMALALTLALDPFLRFWIGEQQGLKAYFVALPLIFGCWANSYAIIPFTRLVASGRPRIPATLHAIEALPYLGILYFGLTWFGLPGAALAWALRCSVDALMLYVFNGMDRRTSRVLFCHGLLVAATCALFYFWPDRSLYPVLIKSIPVVAGIIIVMSTIPPVISSALRREWRERFGSVAGVG